MSSLVLIFKLNEELKVSVPQKGGSISEGIVGTPRFINPVIAVSNADRALTSIVFSGLLKKDENGKEVISIINEKKLKEIAKAGGGEYFHLTGRKNTKKAVVDAIDKQEKRKYKEKLFLDYVSKFQYFIGIGLFFLMLSFFGKSLNTYILNRLKVKK